MNSSNRNHAWQGDEADRHRGLLAKIADCYNNPSPEPIGQSIVSPDGKAYVVIDEAGSGSFANVYRAADKPGGEARYVIKQIPVRDRESKKDFRRRLEREYLISQILLLNSATYCRRRGSCAERLFYGSVEVEGARRTVGYLVFDYVRALSLDKHIRNYHEAYDFVGLDIAAKDYYLAGIDTILSFWESVKRLHTFDIIHRDIKPCNALALTAKKSPYKIAATVRLIDFGNSCARYSRGQRLLKDLSGIGGADLASITCARDADRPATELVYTATPVFRDPASGRGDTESKDSAVRFRPGKSTIRVFKKFDIFAVAVSTQLFFDPQQYTDVTSPMTAGPTGTLVARDTPRMPRLASAPDDPSPLAEMLAEMTGPLEDRHSLAEYVTQLREFRSLVAERGVVDPESSIGRQCNKL